MLLDDVLSELDPRRQEYVLNRIAGGQVFITCCEPEKLDGWSGAKAFRSREGAFSPSAWCKGGGGMPIVIGIFFLLPLFFGLEGVLYSMPVSDILTFLVSAAVIRYTYRTLKIEGGSSDEQK